jgi:hypothetical protein
LFGAAVARADSPVVIAGSSLASPPPFQVGPHSQITPIIDRAYPFTIADGGPYRVEQLQVAAYRLAGLGGTTAEFAIHSDAGGFPGVPLSTFSLTGIPLGTPAIIDATPNQGLVLQPDMPYWIVGTTNQGQVNWSLALGVFPLVSVDGSYAYQLRDDQWVYVPTGSVAAYAILGSAVPEPATILLGLLTASATLGNPFRTLSRRYLHWTSEPTRGPDELTNSRRGRFVFGTRTTVKPWRQ